MIEKEDLIKLKNFCNYWAGNYIKIISIKSTGLSYLITTAVDKRPVILDKIKTKDKKQMLKEFGFYLIDNLHLDFVPGFIEKISLSFYDKADHDNYFQRFFCGDLFAEID